VINMSDPKKLFEETRKSLTPYQHSLHYATGPKNEDDHPDNKIHAVFYSAFRKSTWYFHHPSKIDCVNPGDDTTATVYRAKATPQHGLLYTYLIAKLPAIKAKPGYQVRWCPNVGLNIFKTGVLYFNDNQLQNIDSVYCDNYIQTMISPNERETVDVGLGNVDELQNWSTSLPSYSTSFTIPWFYSLEHTSVFPLYMCGAMDRLEHNLLLRRKISQLLMIRKIGDNNESTMVPFNPEYVTIGTGPSVTEPEIPMPEMYGEYLFLTEMECNFYRCNASGRDMINIDSVYSAEAENPSPLEKTVAITFAEIGYPVHTIHWVAENHTAMEHNYHSNYTTNPLDHTTGRSPIESSTLETSKGPIFRNLERVHTERVHPSKHFRSVPHTPGYNAWTFGMRGYDVDPKPGINMSNGKLTVKLKDTNPYLDDGDTKPPQDTYTIKVRLVYTHRLKFKSWPATEELRSTQPAVVEIISNDD
jgi:hypothetical protein